MHGELMRRKVHAFTCGPTKSVHDISEESARSRGRDLRQQFVASTRHADTRVARAGSLGVSGLDMYTRVHA